MGRRARGGRPGLLAPLARLAGVAALGIAARNHLAEGDEHARELVVGRRSDLLDRALPALTDLGSTYAAATAAGTLWALGRRRLARDVGAAAAIAWLAGQGLKPLFRRARPYDAGSVEVLVRRPAGLSYPSSHPAVAAAIGRVVERTAREPVRGWFRRLPRFVAFSRVYVGVHYPTDVIGGVMLGRAVGDLWLRYVSAGRAERDGSTPSRGR